MKKLVILVLVVLLVSVLFIGSKQNDGNGSKVGNKENAASEKLMRDDEEACKRAKEGNTRSAWERYLREFPAGKCVEEGKAFKNKYKKIGNVKWSNVYNNDDTFFYSRTLAEQYCENLDESGHKDWRLPTVDELEVLVENCSKTKKKGECLFGNMNGINYESNSIFAYSDDESAIWYADNSGIHMEDSGVTISTVSVRCVRQDDHDACETAKKYDKPYLWIFYFDNFPKGECAAEAKVVWGKEDEKACLEAKKENTRAAWEQYLKTFPNGKCVKEGKSVRNKFKKIAGLEWSDLSPEVFFSYYVSGDYCGNLREDGHDDWFMPDIEELRMLVQNHSTTIADGSCDEYTIGSVSDNCRGENGNNFSKLGDRVSIFSSSVVQGYRGKYLDSLGLDFSDGGIYEIYGAYFRCARIIDNDIEACNSVRKDPSFHAWSLYLHNFPKGKCAKEAKKAMDTISCKRAVSSSDWEAYLKDFPHGKCASEAKIIVEVDSCRKAMEENSRAGWEAYLRDRGFQNGRCSYEGKVFVNQYRKIGGLEWSDVSVADDGYFGEASRYSWEEANSYCKELKEGGHRDWRLPTVDELKMLIRNCRKTESEENNGDFEENNGSEEDDVLQNVCLYSRLQGDDDEFGLWGYSDDKSQAWYVASYDGESGIYKVGDMYYCSIAGGCNSVRCVRQEEPEACETAKKYNKSYYWKYYIDNYPKGKCAAEAKAFLGKEHAKDEAKSQIDNSKKNGNHKWSNRSRKAMSWKHAEEYCENLKEDGLSDWRLPTISELRTLITKCESTETSGACGVTDQCLSAGQCKNKACRGCGRKVKHNKFEDKGFFWSSSISPDNKNAWYIDFTYGSVHNHSNSDKFVRCVK